MSADDTVLLTNTDTISLTRLSNRRWLWLARGVWTIGTLLILLLFIISQFNYPPEFQNGCLCDSIARMDRRDGQYILSPRVDDSATGLIHEGDILVAVDGTPVSGDTTRGELSILLDEGSIGSQVTLTIRTGDSPTRDVTLTRSQPAYWMTAGALNFGLSIDFGVGYAILQEVVVMLLFGLVAGLIVRRRSDDWMVLYAAWALLATGFVGLQLLTALRINTLVPPQRFVAVSNFKAAFYVLIYAFALLFPDGRFFPRWSILLVVGFGLWQGFLRLNVAETNRLLLDLVIWVFLVALLLTVRHRYRHYFSPVRRQQSKWVLFGIAVALVSMLVFFSVTTLLNLYAPRQLAIGFFFIALPISRLALLAIPLTFAFAMLRYRLYDVDLVINRGLVYGGLTLLLGAVFLLGLLQLQSILGTLLGGQQTTIAAMLSTGVIVALFNPARTRLQHFVDRRFYGLRVDLNQLADLQKTLPISNPGILSGMMLGSYHMSEVLGRGGMGEVYKGHQTANNSRPVAIKVLSPELANKDELRARFTREAKVVAALEHPHIVQLFDYGEVNGMPYMVMEFVEGQDLGNYLQKRGHLAPDEAHAIIAQIAAALDYAHEQNLVHRDVKPSNVMLKRAADDSADISSHDYPSYYAVLMDFGVTKLLSSGSSLTQTGALGTLQYMAPEQIMSAKQVDHRADVYSLGIMAYQLLTGQLPFSGESVGQLLFAHLNQPPPDPRDLNEDIPLRTAKAIMKAMSKQPEDRFSSAGEFAAALK